MLFFANVKISQPHDMSIERLYELWNQEAEVTANEISSGYIKDVWKVAGKRQVIAILDVESHDQLDQAIESVPIVRAMGGSIDIEILPIRPYDNWAQDLAKEVGDNPGP